MTSQSTTPDETESQIASPHDMTRVSPTDDQRVVVCVRGFRGEKIEFSAKETKIAHCILAQKDHAMSNLGEDLVLWKKR